MEILLFNNYRIGVVKWKLASFQTAPACVPLGERDIPQAGTEHAGLPLWGTVVCSADNAELFQFTLAAQSLNLKNIQKIFFLFGFFYKFQGLPLLAKETLHSPR